MGCLSSKPEAESEDRTFSEDQLPPQHHQQSQSSQAHHASTSVPIGVPGRPSAGVSGRNNNLDVSTLSRSYTEARLAEEEFFEAIIKRTENNLINANDLVEESAPQSGLDSVKNNYSMVISNGTGFGTRTTLPVPSASNVNVVKILQAAPRMPDTMTTRLISCAVEVGQAFADIDVNDVGDIVVDLPTYL